MRDRAARELITRLKKATDPAERTALAAELDALPPEPAKFADRWLLLHDAGDFRGWFHPRPGYEPKRSPVPRDVQLLVATRYGRGDILNGGMRQFFGNPTGGFAPEMLEWFDRAGLPDAATLLREGMTVFGPDYPRSQGPRIDVLEAAIPRHADGTPAAPRAEWDPFRALDDPFFRAARNDVFDPAAGAWLRDVCGIGALSQPYTPTRSPTTPPPGTVAVERPDRPGEEQFVDAETYAAARLGLATLMPHGPEAKYTWEDYLRFLRPALVKDLFPDDAAVARWAEIVWLDAVAHGAGPGGAGFPDRES